GGLTRAQIRVGRCSLLILGAIWRSWWQKCVIYVHLAPRIANGTEKQAAEAAATAGVRLRGLGCRRRAARCGVRGRSAGVGAGLLGVHGCWGRTVAGAARLLGLPRCSSTGAAGAHGSREHEAAATSAQRRPSYLSPCRRTASAAAAMVSGSPSSRLSVT